MDIEAPPDEIRPNERIGRRVFGEDKNIFEEVKGVRHYRANIFIDTRQGDLSVDRIGLNSPVKKQVNFLQPLGVAMGKGMRPPVEFRGWVQLRVSDVKCGVVKKEAVGEVNPFHAEISRDQYQTKDAQRSLAYELCRHALKWDFVPRKQASKVSS